MLRLGVNIDHVATVRNARGTSWPDPLRAALLAQEAGADGITAHLREDRRHISDADSARLSDRLHVPLDLEMAATAEMQAIALRHRPHAVCIVPEKREERTTEGGLDAAGQFEALKPFVERLGEAGQIDESMEPLAKIEEIRAKKEEAEVEEEQEEEPEPDVDDEFDQLEKQDVQAVEKDKDFALALRDHIRHGVNDAVRIHAEEFRNTPWHKRAWYGTAFLIYRAMLRVITMGRYT